MDMNGCRPASTGDETRAGAFERRGTLDLEIEDEAALRERAARLFVGIFLGAVSLGFVLLTALLGWSGVFSAG